MVNVVVKPGQDQLVVIIQHARTPVHIIHNAYQLHQVLLALHLPVVRQAVLKAVHQHLLALHLPVRQAVSKAAHQHLLAQVNLLVVERFFISNNMMLIIPMLK
jgi:hypothetical protein